MDLTIFFSPVDESVYEGIESASSFFKSISVFGDKMPDYRGARIALIGIGDSRGSENGENATTGPDEIRKKLYRLKRGKGGARIVDLGNLNPGVDDDVSSVRDGAVCRVLLENNVLPVISGGSQDLDYGQCTAYESMEKLVSFLNVDAFLELEEGSEALANRKHIHRVLL